MAVNRLRPSLGCWRCLRRSNEFAEARPSTPCLPLLRRRFCIFTPIWSHENPLGLPRNNQRIPPTMPRRGKGGVPEKRAIPHVKQVIAVSSGKGGVGKSTVAVNLALGLAASKAFHSVDGRPARVGILDLDIFGPSIPIMMGLQRAGEPDLTEAGALLPLLNHGVPCMSMGFLLPASPDGSNEDVAVVWRGMMVMKAVQQLLFDVDWRIGGAGAANAPLDVLIVDMPPGTGDVALSLTQLVKVDGAVIVSTPQETALADARKGATMFRKITGLVLNMSHFYAPDTGHTYPLFGSPASLEAFAKQLAVPVIARLPLEPAVSEGGDSGIPIVAREDSGNGLSKGAFLGMADFVWNWLQKRHEISTK